MFDRISAHVYAKENEIHCGGVTLLHNPGLNASADPALVLLHAPETGSCVWKHARKCHDKTPLFPPSGLFLQQTHRHSLRH